MSLPPHTAEGWDWGIRVRADLPPIHPMHPHSQRCPFRHWLRGAENAHLMPQEVAACENAWPET